MIVDNELVEFVECVLLVRSLFHSNNTIMWYSVNP